MPKYNEIFSPTTNTIDQFNQSIVLVGMLLVVFICVINILFTIKHLADVFKNRDHSLTQNGHILFRLVFMGIMGYVIYEIVQILFEIGGLKI